MKSYLWPSIRISLVLLVLLSVIYPLLIAGIGQLAPGKGEGRTIQLNGRTVGFVNVGQQFNRDEYFWSRPSAVNYDGGNSGGSNKGPSNEEYLTQVELRIRYFLQSNPGVKRSQIPAELVTASGSGLDPHLSPPAAKIQIARIAKIRNIQPEHLMKLVDQYTEKPLLGPEVVNVLKLNVALDSLYKK
ncbi:MAG TPA: potassium-transporting ATPase subunit KdpC [Daejeonella sp.]|nr:potassium-transporting ATPase subunit KdpC [Daejeonella sp.]